jgi:hypothetical protein
MAIQQFHLAYHVHDGVKELGDFCEQSLGFPANRWPRATWARMAKASPPETPPVSFFNCSAAPRP